MLRERLQNTAQIKALQTDAAQSACEPTAPLSAPGLTALLPQFLVSDLLISTCTLRALDSCHGATLMVKALHTHFLKEGSHEAAAEIGDHAGACRRCSIGVPVELCLR